MKVNVDIIFKDGTQIHAEDVKMKDLMLYVSDELTLETVSFGLYKRQGNVVLAQCIEDTVLEKHIYIVPA